PAANYHGPVAFDYTISDGHGGVETAHVAIAVVSLDALPVAVSDTFSMLEDAVVTNTLVGNDTLSADGGNTYALRAG
ncbi:Ig-like domain-containing protein, partial [Variovorax sp. KK3]|uniref:Ig-like domain-containing protein n=1 Tax=Variovorax sp. KK3 TaxID=1855728 RepID=UPI0015C3C769